MTPYTTLHGEMLDDIVYRHYGSHDCLRLVLDANPNLAKLGAVLPDETVINLPPKPVATKQTIKLWG